MDWISVKDKFPPQHEPVLVLITADDDDYALFNNMQVAYHTANQWIGKDSGLCDVSHWLPLPPAPLPPVDEDFEAVKFAADSVMSHYAPADAQAKTFSFNITVSGRQHTAYYERDEDGYWDFKRYDQ